MVHELKIHHSVFNFPCTKIVNIKNSLWKTDHLGRSGIRVAPFALGGNVFGWTIQESASFDILDEFVQVRFQFNRHCRRIFHLGSG